MTPSQQLPSAPSMSATPGTLARPGRSWLLFGVELLLVLAAFALLWPTTRSLLGEWEDTDKTTYTHGYLIVLISLWLLLRNRSELGLQRIAPSMLACVLLAGASLVWLICLRSGIRTGEQMMLPAMMGLALWGAMGKRIALLAAFALGYLYFAIPLWGSFNGLLQSATVTAVDLMLRVSGVPAWVEGNIVHLAAGTFEIAGGCSGLHFFVVALALAALYGEVHRDNLPTRLKVMALAAGLALITNWVRVYSIILAGYLTDMQHYLVRVEHYRFGWVVFAAMMAVFFYMAHRFPATDRGPASATQTEASTDSRLGLLRGTALVIAAFAIGPLWNAVAPVRAAALPAAAALLPANPGEWIGPRAADGRRWHAVFAGADAQFDGEYASGGRTVQAFTAAYAWQAQGKELVGFENTLVEPGSMLVSGQPLAAGDRAVELIVANAAGKQSVLWYTYLIDGMQTGHALWAQVGYGIASLVNAPVSRVAALRSTCEPDCAAARSALRDFARASGWPRVPAESEEKDRSWNTQ
jgi:exosortase A